MLMQEHFVNGMVPASQPGTKSYMPQHASFSLHRDRITMGEKNKSFGNKPGPPAITAATCQKSPFATLSFHTSTGIAAA